MPIAAGVSGTVVVGRAASFADAVSFPVENEARLAFTAGWRAHFDAWHLGVVVLVLACFRAGGSAILPVHVGLAWAGLVDVVTGSDWNGTDLSALVVCAAFHPVRVEKSTVANITLFLENAFLVAQDVPAGALATLITDQR